MEYRFSPRPQTKGASLLLSSLAGGSLLALVLGMGNVLGLRTLWHFLLLLFLVGALFLYLRFVASTYTYEITSEWGEPTLVILETQGRRSTTRCRLGLAHLLRLVEVPDGESEEGRRALAEFRAERRRFSYLASLGRVPTQLLYAREGGERFVIRIEGDAAFLDALRQAIALAEEYRVVPEDDE